MPRLTLSLVRIPNVLGIYGASKDQFPARMSLMHPEAAAGFAALQKVLGMRVRVSDMFRTAEQSMQAMQEKSGVMPPGFSLHNYAIAIDIDTDFMLTQTKLTKPALDVLFRDSGWYCHRRDGKRGMEDWHYNFLGSDGPKLVAAAEAIGAKTNTSTAAEAKIRAIYGDLLKLDPKEVQECLAHLKLYGGEIDGLIGPRTQQAIMAFQRAWKLQPTGQMDERTERTLAYVSASLSVADSAPVA